MEIEKTKERRINSITDCFSLSNRSNSYLQYLLSILGVAFFANPLPLSFKTLNAEAFRYRAFPKHIGSARFQAFPLPVWSLICLAVPLPITAQLCLCLSLPCLAFPPHFASVHFRALALLITSGPRYSDTLLARRIRSLALLVRSIPLPSTSDQSISAPSQCFANPSRRWAFRSHSLSEQILFLGTLDHTVVEPAFTAVPPLTESAQTTVLQRFEDRALMGRIQQLNIEYHSASGRQRF